MTDFVKFLKIHNLDEIQSQLYNLATNAARGSRGFNVTRSDIKQYSPALLDWINSRSKRPPVTHRIFITPPNDILDPHIDGWVSNPEKFAINIPISGCEGTHHVYYNCKEDNIVEIKDQSNKRQGYSKIVSPKDKSQMKELSRYEITKPALVKVNIMHGVENFKNTNRIMMSIRWPMFFTDLEQVFDTTDLYEG